ncbi:MAG: twin-arginine translocase subunit TatC [Omnitrophica WOR_2 bacterium]
MTLIQHLEELRQRILISLAAVLIAAVVAFLFSDKILRLLLLPSGFIHLNAFNIMDGFFIKWQVALYTGVVLAFPIWAYELYHFIQPGLLESERRAMFPMLFGALFLFLLGSAFGYYLLSGMIRVLLQLFPSQVSLLPSADGYISFITFFLLASGLAFQLPVVLILLVKLRILNTHTMRRQRKIAYFALFAFAEVITPISDPIVAPLTVMAPLIILYEVSIWFGSRIEAKRGPQELIPEP